MSYGEVLISFKKSHQVLIADKKYSKLGKRRDNYQINILGANKLLMKTRRLRKLSDDERRQVSVISQMKMIFHQNMRYKEASLVDILIKRLPWQT